MSEQIIGHHCREGRHDACWLDWCECGCGHPRIGRACSRERHGACVLDGCGCGCHWLMPLAAGEVDEVVAPSGRVWVRVDGSSVHDYRL